jgi:hypothetical protein
MSSEHNAKHVAEMAMGAVQELARRGGTRHMHPHGVAKAGAALVAGAAYLAPGAVASAGAATAAGLAATAAVAAAAAPFAAVAAAGYGVYRLAKWLDS